MTTWRFDFELPSPAEPAAFQMPKPQPKGPDQG